MPPVPDELLEDAVLRDAIIDYLSQAAMRELMRDFDDRPLTPAQLAGMNEGPTPTEGDDDDDQDA